MLLGSISTGVITSITDSMVMKIAETENSNFGKMRVWGTIGWGLISSIVGFINALDIKFLPQYTPGILLFVFLQIIDLLLVSNHLKKIRNACQKSNLKKERRPTLEEAIEKSISQSMNQNYVNSQIDKDANHSGEQLNVSKDKLSSRNDDSQLIERKHKKQIMKFVFLTCWKHPMLIKYIFICVIVGLCTALNWNYYPLFLDQLSKNDTMLVGFTQNVQCFASEMPFIYFSGHFIDQIGSKASFSIVLFTFALRYFLYTFFNKTNAYYILFVEMTHGITFGLFYYTMNVLAREYSKKMSRIEYNYLMKNVYNRKDLTIVENGAITNSTKAAEFQEKSIKESEHDDSTFSTMQGIMSGAYEGVGIALGSLVSGNLIATNGNINQLFIVLSD